MGNLDLSTSPGTLRRRHTGDLALAVRDDWQGKGVGTALMEGFEGSPPYSAGFVEDGSREPVSGAGPSPRDPQAPRQRGGSETILF